MTRSGVVLLLALCAFSADVRGAGGDEAALRELNRRWFDAETRRDLEGTLGFLAVDAVLQPPGAPEIRGHTAIRKYYKELFTLPFVSITGGPTTIAVAASSDIAYDIGVSKLVLNTPQGTVEEDGKYLLVWKKIGGAWKGVAISWSGNAPPLPAPPPK